MLYIIHDEQVACAVINPRPIHPVEWTPGSIVRFTTVDGVLSDSIEFTILASMSGVAWHLEVLGTSRAERLDQPGTHVAVRVLRSLKADDEMLVMIRDFVLEKCFAADASADDAPVLLKAS